MIRLESVSKAFGDEHALYDVSLDFPKNQVTALIGPSGCGKSTILRLIEGLISPTQGRVLIDDEEVTPAAAPQLRRRMGYVIQDGGLFPHLTAAQNISLMARHLRQSWGERLGQLAQLTRFPEDALDRFPGELSGGQRQRVGLMRGLMLEPDYLLLDEPLGALDPLVRAALQTDLKEIFSELRQTVILVTHDMAEAAYLADRIVLLRNGQVVQEGTLQDFQERPSDPFVTEFLNAQRRMVAL